MTLRTRVILIVAVMTFILAVAGAYTLVSWLDDSGMIGWAQTMREKYVTGTTITITIVLLVLIGMPASCTWLRRCPVCEQMLVQPGNYCSACGSRV